MSTPRQKDAALVRAVADLPALNILREQWAQRSDESKEEHFALMDWIDQTKRGAPPEQHRSLAARQDWAGRAAAYDRAAEISLRAANSGRDQGSRITDNVMLAVELASVKLARAEASSEQLVMSVKEIKDFIALLRQLQRDTVDATLSATDLSGLTAEELRMWLTLNQKIEDTRVKK